MSKFKVGDKVRVVAGYGDLEYGSVHTVVKVSDSAQTINLGDCWWWDFSRFELLKENNVFDLKKEKWFIRVNGEEHFHLIDNWVKKNYGDSITNHYEGMVGITNTDNSGLVCNRVMFVRETDLEKTRRNEIKLTFKIETIVEYPVVETEQEIKIRELKETIEKAQKQIDEIINNKN